MSGPYMSAFSGANMGIPGYSSGPGSSNLGLTGGPGVRSLDWDGKNVGQAAAFLNYGDVPGSYGTPYFLANDFIQQQYVIHPWADGAHLHIAEFQIVCGLRSVADHDLNMYTQVSLAKLNELLKAAHDTYEAMTAPAALDPEAAEFARLLEEYGEDMLENYHRARKAGDYAVKNMFTGVTNGSEAELRKFYDMAINKPVLRYMTKLGILSHWNIIGITVGVNRGTGLDETDNAMHSERVTVINNIVAKRAMVHNIFGDNRDIPTGADTWLVLRRVMRRGNRGPGRFEIVPYASRSRISVPRDLAIYSDSRDGSRIVSSHVHALGVVTKPAGRDAPQGLREMSTGLNGNHKAAFETIATLPQIQIQVGM
jgi:hypothetical protein